MIVFYYDNAAFFIHFSAAFRLPRRASAAELTLLYGREQDLAGGPHENEPDAEARSQGQRWAGEERAGGGPGPPDTRSQTNIEVTCPRIPRLRLRAYSL